jgi:hypothetical protein
MSTVWPILIGLLAAAPRQGPPVPVLEVLPAPCPAVTAVSYNASHLYVACGAGVAESVVDKIDLAGEIVGSFTLEPGVVAMDTFGDLMVVLPADSDDSLFLVDLTTNEVLEDRIPVPGEPPVLQLSFDEQGALWVFRWSLSTTWVAERISLEDGAVEFSTELDALSVLFGAFAWGGGRLWQLASSGLFRVDETLTHAALVSGGWDADVLPAGSPLDHDGEALWGAGYRFVAGEPEAFLVRFATEPTPVVPVSWGGLKVRWGGERWRAPGSASR